MQMGTALMLCGQCQCTAGMAHLDEVRGQAWEVCAGSAAWALQPAGLGGLLAHSAAHRQLGGLTGQLGGFTGQLGGLTGQLGVQLSSLGSFLPSLRSATTHASHCLLYDAGTKTEFLLTMPPLVPALPRQQAGSLPI